MLGGGVNVDAKCFKILRPWLEMGKMRIFGVIGWKMVFCYTEQIAFPRHFLKLLICGLEINCNWRKYLNYLESS